MPSEHWINDIAHVGNHEYCWMVQGCFFLLRKFADVLCDGKWSKLIWFWINSVSSRHTLTCCILCTSTYKNKRKNVLVSMWLRSCSNTRFFCLHTRELVGNMWRVSTKAKCCKHKFQMLFWPKTIKKFERRNFLAITW